MHGERAKHPYYMDLGADKVWENFNTLLSKMSDEDKELPHSAQSFSSVPSNVMYVIHLTN